jgi:hypothetical protein
MRRKIVCGVAAAVLAVATGCSKQADPTQPKMTDDQIKDVMKQGREQSKKEHGKRGPGGAPVRQ